MKAHLMFKDEDFDMQQPLPVHEKELMQDLELDILFEAMSLRDDFLFDVSKRTILSGLKDPESIRYRQDILKDCIHNPSAVRDIYNISLESMRNKRKYWLGIFTRHPGAILNSSVRMLQMFVELLKKLKSIADEEAGQFESEGFLQFFSMIRKELDDEYFAAVQRHLMDLKFPHGVLVSARLGKGNEGGQYILRKAHTGSSGRLQRFLAGKPPVFSFYVNPRDESGSRALSDLRDQGINLVANALAKSADHINSFFEMLRTELSFYIGCLNLHDQLLQTGAPVSFPSPSSRRDPRQSFKDLQDVSLILTTKSRVVGNDVRSSNADLTIITGANQGGKSTFLRSIGLAQLMMQSGMFVTADFFSAPVCNGIFTHYKREEDASMESGKLDEELKRMSSIVDMLSPYSMVLFNESFAATNEREGSEIAKQIVRVLLENHIKVFFVTHLFTFARDFFEEKPENTTFLRAERQSGGVRTFKMTEGEPLRTSYGRDLYEKIFL